MALPQKLPVGMVVNKTNINDLVNIILGGQTLFLTGTAPTGYTRQFQHQDWVDFVDPVQAGGNNGFNERFHALEQEFDLIAAAVSSVDNAVTNLQGAPPAVGLVLVPAISDGAKIPVPSGFQQSETKFFCVPKIYNVNTQQAGSSFGFGAYAQDDGTVHVSAGNGQFLVASGIAISKKGGW